MEQENVPNIVPYIVYESAQARSERTIKRLIIALVIAVILLFASNAIWTYEWTQYDYVSETTCTETTYQQDGQGLNIIGDANHVADQTGESDCSTQDADAKGWLAGDTPQEVIP